jgi:glutaredoxin
MFIVFKNVAIINMSLTDVRGDIMFEKRSIEIFSAGCPLCDEAVKKIRELACPSCDVTVLNMKDPASFKRAKELGVNSVPAVAINGELAGCCTERGIKIEALQNAGLGKPLTSN